MKLRCPACHAVTETRQAQERCDCGEVNTYPIRPRSPVYCTGCKRRSEWRDVQVRCHCGRAMRVPPPPDYLTPPVSPRLPPQPATTDPTVCPCGCGVRLSLIRKGAGAGYRRTYAAAVVIDTVLIRLVGEGGPRTQVSALHGHLEDSRDLCSFWLAHCHQSATSASTPDMLHLKRATEQMERLAASLAPLAT